MPDEHDRQLGLGGVHIDAGAPHLGGYDLDLVEDINAMDAAHKAGIDPDIEIKLASIIIDGTPKSEAVLKI